MVAEDVASVDKNEQAIVDLAPILEGATNSRGVASCFLGRRRQSVTLGTYFNTVEILTISSSKIPLLIELERTTDWNIFLSQCQKSLVPGMWESVLFTHVQNFYYYHNAQVVRIHLRAIRPYQRRRRRIVRRALVVLCVLDFLVVQKQRKLCIFALLVEFTCVTEEGESQNQHASRSGTLVHISILLQRKIQLWLLHPVHLLAAKKPLVLLSPKTVRGDPLEGKSRRILLKEGNIRKQ